MWFSPMLDQYKYLPSCQILIPRTSHRRPPSTSPGRSLKLLFNHPGDVPIWRPWDVLIYVQGMSLGGWFRTSPGRSQDVRYRTFKARLRDDVGSWTGCPKISFYFSFGTYSIEQIYLKAIQHSRSIENPVELLRWSIFVEIS